MFVRFLIFFAIATVVLYVFRALKSAAPRRLFTIRVAVDHVTIEGRIPSRQHSEVVALVDELHLPIGAEIYGVEDGKTDFAVRGSRTIRPDDMKRLRDFLKGPALRLV